ncbi:MAG TPA: hypothetical protein VGR19_02630 [Allosphingosinicella sp.]|nr:hypothetical protein [Allosphingosinicella sp.]
MNSGFWSDSSPAAPLPVPDELALRSRASRKKRRWAYFRWLLLGSHYLYLRRPFTQLLFWATLGGLLLWWLIDLTRIPGLVRRHNERALAKLIDEYHDLLELRVHSDAQPVFELSSMPAAARTPSALETRPAAVLLLSGALVATAALYVFNPPRLFPEAESSGGSLLAFGPFP